MGVGETLGEYRGRWGRATRVDALWVHRRNVKKRRKGTWEHKVEHIYWDVKDGSVSDGMSVK